MSKILFGDNFENDVESIVYRSIYGDTTTKTIKDLYEFLLRDSANPAQKIFYLFFAILSKLPWSP